MWGWGAKVVVVVVVVGGWLWWSWWSWWRDWGGVVWFVVVLGWCGLLCCWCAGEWDLAGCRGSWCGGGKLAVVGFGWCGGHGAVC